MSTPETLLNVDIPFRFILSTETNANSPDNEVTYGGMRLNWEAFIKYVGGPTDIGSVTADPNDAPDGVLETSLLPPASPEGLYVGRLLVIRDGDAISNILYIADVVGTPLEIDQFTLSANLRYSPGDPLANLWALGVRQGNTYAVIHNIVRQGDGGHTHDGVDQALLAPNSVSLTQLKTATGYIVHEDLPPVSPGFSYVFFPTSVYMFYPAITRDIGLSIEGDFTISHWYGEAFPPSYPYYSALSFEVGAPPPPAGFRFRIQYRYVSASGDVNWLFFRRYKNGEIQHLWAAPDHPCGCCGSPEAIPHPYFANEKDDDSDIIVVNPSMEEWNDINMACYPTADGGYLDRRKMRSSVEACRSGASRENPYTAIKDSRRGKRSFDEALFDLFDIDYSRGHWTDKLITVGLPDFDDDGNFIGDYRNVQHGTRVRPLKRKLEQPKDVSVAVLKRK